MRRGFIEFTLWTPVFFLKVLLELAFDIGRLFIGFPFVFLTVQPRLAVSGHNYNKEVHYAHCFLLVFRT